MEIAAYRIGCVIGVDVPASHAAIGFDGSPGSLTEWMFDASAANEGIFRNSDVRDVIYPLCDFDMPVRLSKNRAEFICRMVCERRDMLMEKLNA